ncbi:MAG: hypothetical protein IKY89_02510, partial [Alistipes sp.]|nr:hypothetical protein [Alistipes sp.]
MKKLLVSVLAIAGLVACNNEQTLVQKGNAPMEFAGAYVENATRADKAFDPSTTTSSLTAFDVWGFMDEPSGVVFEGEDVTGEQGNFTYTNTQYWLPEHQYYFAALAPMNSANWRLNTEAANVYGAGIVDFVNVDGTEDLIYASAHVSTTGKQVGDAMDKVMFQFHHLLSKVKFSFTNGFANDNAYIDVKNVRMVVPQAGSINLAQADWWSTNQWNLTDATTTLAFGDACAKTGRGGVQQVANERLTIPANAGQVYIIEFDVQLYFGDVAAWTEAKTLTATVKDVALEMGKAYNFKTTIDASNISPDGKELQPIVFDVDEVNKWDEAGDVAFEPTVHAATAAQVEAALLAGQNVTLTADINLDELEQTRSEIHHGLQIDQDFVLDGNGFTISSTAKRAILMEQGANVVLKNFTLNATGERGIQMQGEGHNVTIENVVATSANYTVYLTGTSANSKVVVKNCDLTGLNTINVWGENHEVTVENSKITTIDNSAAEGYAPVYNVADNTTVYVNGGEVVITGEHAEDTVAGVINGSANIVFNGTEGDCTVEGHKFGIYYANGYCYTFSTFAEVYETAKAGETIVLLNDVQIDAPLQVAKDLVLNLNGYTLKNAVENAATDVIVVAEGATLTVEGDGVIEAVSGNDGYTIIADGTVVINGGEFKAGMDANGEANAVVYARGNGQVYVNGGYFPNENASNYVLNKKDADKATTVIEVRGGKFVGFNPAQSPSEYPVENFVAEGYYSTEVEAGVFVVADAYTVANVAGLQAALDAKIEDIRFAANIEGDVVVSQTEGVNYVIDGAGYKFDGTLGICGNARSKGTETLTIKNVAFETAATSLDFISSTKAYVAAGQNYNYAHNVTIDGCTFTAAEGSDVVGIRGWQDFNLVVKNCDMKGGHSLAQITASSNTVVEGCTIKAGRGIN